MKTLGPVVIFKKACKNFDESLVSTSHDNTLNDDAQVSNNCKEEEKSFRCFKESCWLLERRV